MVNNVAVRLVEASDAAALCKIYAPYVLNTTISFETKPPDEAEFTHRISDISKDFPYIKCEINGEIIGYAYAHRYRERSAYRWCAELSIYVIEKAHGLGVGRALYFALLSFLKLMRYQSAYGVVTCPNPESDRLHLAMGFENTGTLQKCGYKLGKWIGVTTYQLFIGSHPEDPAEPLSISDIPAERIGEILMKSTELISRRLRERD